LHYYDQKILQAIVNRSAGILQIPLNEDASKEISGRSRGTPRIANALLRRVRDYAQVKGDGIITNEITQMALTALQVDKHGLDEMDNKILIAIIDKYKGGPVGINTLATVVGEESGTIEEVYEPFLVQQGYMVRTSRGRMVTDMAYKHLNKPKNDLGQQEIF
jgi:Holliday junction DNA helicase RuvB